MENQATLLNFYASHVKNAEKNVFSNESSIQKLNEPNFLDIRDLQQQINSLSEQVISINTLSMPDNKLMQSMSKTASQMFNNLKFSPMPKQNAIIKNIIFFYFVLFKEWWKYVFWLRTRKNEESRTHEPGKAAEDRRRVELDEGLQ